MVRLLWDGCFAVRLVFILSMAEDKLILKGKPFLVLDPKCCHISKPWDGFITQPTFEKMCFLHSPLRLVAQMYLDVSQSVMVPNNVISFRVLVIAMFPLLGLVRRHIDTIMITS